MNIYLKRLILTQILKRPAPLGWISQSKENNFMAAFLHFEGKGPKVRVQEVRKGHILCYQIEDEKTRYECSIRDENINQAQLIVRHWFKGIEIKYLGYFDYLKSQVTLFPQRQILREKMSQQYFNRTLKIREDRYEVLQTVIDMHISRAAEQSIPVIYEGEINPFEIYQNLYSHQIWGHPQNQEILAKLTLILDSFVESGELSRTGTNYKLHGKALAEIASHSLEERRHRDATRQTQWIINLTAIIALAAILEILY